MTIEVMRQRPANNEGQLGEMRLVVASNGMFLYVKGYGRWEFVKMNNVNTRPQIDRNERTTLQDRVRTVIVQGSAAADHGEGEIATGGSESNVRGGGGPPMHGGGPA